MCRNQVSITCSILTWLAFFRSVWHFVYIKAPSDKFCHWQVSLTKVCHTHTTPSPSLACMSYQVCELLPRAAEGAARVQPRPSKANQGRAGKADHSAKLDFRSAEKGGASRSSFSIHSFSSYTLQCTPWLDTIGGRLDLLIWFQYQRYVYFEPKTW